MKHTPTPAALGYRMPAEWEPHAGTWFTWPRPEGISFPGKYDTVPPVYAELISHLVTVEDVHINVWHAEMEAWVRGLLRENSGSPRNFAMCCGTASSRSNGGYLPPHAL